MRVADFISNYLSNQGVRHVFLVSGGGMMFLSDALALNKNIEYVCTHHEQAAAMAAAAYAKYSGALSVCYVTTGCGGTNAITGVLNAWQDSTPCLFISGQSKRKETIRNSGLPLRQFGVQEADIVQIIDSITKYAVMLNEPGSIAYHLDKAIHIATTGRPGPVWIDVPLDVQAAEIDPEKLERFIPDLQDSKNSPRPSDAQLNRFVDLLNHSDRPVILAGHGVRLAKAIEAFEVFVEKYQIPVVTSTLGVDLLPYDSKFYVGKAGNKGTRPGNFAIQNSDLLIVMGCRLSVSTTGHEYDKFARNATIIVVDIDAIEHQKNTVKIDEFIDSDLRTFLEEVSRNSEIVPISRIEWLTKCAHWKKKYPTCLPAYKDETNGLNLYHFVDTLCTNNSNNIPIVWDAGSALYVATQAARLKKGQRLIGSGGQAEMGFTVPATIGVSAARNHAEVIGITGDGSFQMNIQELQTIYHHQLPIKLFIWNNNGYLSIRSTQKRFFDSRLIGTDSSCGVSFPSLEKIAFAYGIPYRKLENSFSLGDEISGILAIQGPVLCEVICNPNQEIVPAVASTRRPDGSIVSRPLEDMYPFLDRSELAEEMVVPLLED